jgi:alkanesulfonate monooxygenase SsuD/methylene tetrahydromethanopterin reductase-like flavin-dependent oxidoreductase (luciferase family)
VFTMRFDMRIHPDGAPAHDLYAAALEMCAWAESRGCVGVQVSEHHASPDGYLPAPLTLASGIAARTKSLPIQVAALLVPLHDPVALAEQMAVLDVMSRGRVSYVCAIGYRPEEYALFGRPMRGRGARLEESLEVIRRALSGEVFEWQGREVCVTPAPFTDGGPTLLLGGGSEAAVKRAGRLGLGMITQGGDPGLQMVYETACRAAGTTPGLFINPPPRGVVMSGFVARDPDAAWAELGPFLLHDARMYASWLGDTETSTLSRATTVDELRAEEGAYRIFSVQGAVEHVRANGLMLTQPLCGGLPTELGWRSLELLAEEVLPAVADTDSKK